jgi:hypothetical protein
MNCVISHIMYARVPQPPSMMTFLLTKLIDRTT